MRFGQISIKGDIANILKADLGSAMPTSGTRHHILLLN